MDWTYSEKEDNYGVPINNNAPVRLQECEAASTDPLKEYVSEADESILNETGNNLWNEKHTNLAKEHILTIHLYLITMPILMSPS